LILKQFANVFQAAFGRWVLGAQEKGASGSASPGSGGRRDRPQIGLHEFAEVSADDPQGGSKRKAQERRQAECCERADCDPQQHICVIGSFGRE
jgi:hypothetical protein